ncbi:MAG: hypothetical protein MNPFHGCM_03238 [Gemmatimonadaceae bacterium]|nr:hypothetical protein [Gemmatimonadaceae bacterium]
MLLTALSILAATSLAPTPTLYRAEFVQAAPGRLLDLIDFVKGQMPAYDRAREPRPFLMRHSQGDRWDLMLLVPMGDNAPTYFSADRTALRERAGLSGAASDARWRDLVTWHEVLYVRGPALDDVKREFDTSGFAHIEIFRALAGHFDALKQEREMEATFNATVGRAKLLYFEREPTLGGAAWDMFTIDLYRDLTHYAQASAFTAEAGDAAARKAGFESSAMIGPTMRRHISTHHDTLAGVLK